MRRGHSIAAGALLLALFVNGRHTRAEDAAPAAPDKATLAAAIRQIASVDAAKGAAGDAIVKAGTSAVEPLRLALMDALPDGTRAAAACLLGRIGSAARPALPALVIALEDYGDDVPYRAAEAIERIGWPEGRDLEALVAKRQHSSPRVRRVAFRAALATGRSQAGEIEPLLAASLTRHVISHDLSGLGGAA